MSEWGKYSSETELERVAGLEWETKARGDEEKEKRDGEADIEG